MFNFNYQFTSSFINYPLDFESNCSVKEWPSVSRWPQVHLIIFTWIILLCFVYLIFTNLFSCLEGPWIKLPFNFRFIFNWKFNSYLSLYNVYLLSYQLTKRAIIIMFPLILTWMSTNNCRSGRGYHQNKLTSIWHWNGIKLTRKV